SNACTLGAISTAEAPPGSSRASPTRAGRRRAGWSGSGSGPTSSGRSGSEAEQGGADPTGGAPGSAGGQELALGRRRLNRLLQLLEGAHLDLAHALAADPVFLRQILERRRILLEAALGEDV